MAGHYQERLSSALVDTKAIFNEIKRDVAEIEGIVDGLQSSDLETEKLLVCLQCKLNALAEKIF